MGAHLRLVRQFVADKGHPLVAGLLIILLSEAISAHFPIQDIDVRFGALFLDLQSVLDGLGAADSTAIGPLRFPRTHALDHHHARGGLLTTLRQPFDGAQGKAQDTVGQSLF